MMKTINISEDPIKLGQALKLAGLVESGVDAKIDIQEGLVKVNGEITLQRGRKIYSGDVIEYDGLQIMINKAANETGSL